MSDVWTDSYIKDLSEQDIENFQEIVVKDVKSKSVSDEEKTALKNNLELWLYCLQITRREVEWRLAQFKTNIKIKINEQLTNKASDISIKELRVAEEKWRNNAMKFLNSIEKKTLYVKLLLDEEELIEE